MKVFIMTLTTSQSWPFALLTGNWQVMNIYPVQTSWCKGLLYALSKMTDKVPLEGGIIMYHRRCHSTPLMPLRLEALSMLSSVNLDRIGLHEYSVHEPASHESP